MPSSHVFPRPSAAYKGRDLGDEYLFYDQQGDKLHVLNGTARAIYLLCDGTRSEEQVSSAFAETYDVDQETALEDTRETVRQLIDLGLIQVGD